MKELLLGVTPFWFWGKNFSATSGLAAAPTQPQACTTFQDCQHFKIGSCKLFICNMFQDPVLDDSLKKTFSYFL